MAEGFLSDLGVNIGVNGISFTWVANIIIIVLALALTGVLTYLYLNQKSYNKILHVFRNINGRPIPVGIQKSREVLLPFTSTKAFQVKKGGFFLPRPSIETGKDHYWYIIRDDGEWVNVGLENFNEKLKKLGLFFDHADMRMANASLKKLVEKNYKKTNWIKEWAPYIGFGMIILMLGIAGYLVMQEAGKVTTGLSGAVESMGNIADKFERILIGTEGRPVIEISSGVKNAG